MKKASCLVLMAFILLVFAGCNKSNEPISEQEALSMAGSCVLDDSTILNYDSPEIEMLEIAENHTVAYTDEGGNPTSTDIQGKTVWKVMYQTEYDNLLGPVTIYIDYYTGAVYGMDLRF